MKRMSLRNEQCRKVCRILDDVLANRPTERDSLITAVRKAFGALETEPKWIPVREMLPEDEQNVLVTYKTTDKIHPCQYHDDGSRNPWYSYIDQCRAHMNVVLAWMPLPEPYTE